MQVVLTLEPGGAERLVIETARRLHRTYRMVVCCLDAPGRWADTLRAEGIPVVALERPPGFRPSIGRALAAVARRHDAGVLHCHQYSPFVYGCVARMFAPGLRVIFTEHGRLDDATATVRRRAANFVLGRLPHRVYAVSRDLRRHMEAEGLRQVELIGNGIDPGEIPTLASRLEARREAGVPDRSFVVGSVGRLDPVKDLSTLLRGFRLLLGTRPDAHLVVVGDGPERTRLEEEAAALGLAGRCRFLGQRGDARRLMAGFDAYVNSSIFEGVSLTILEAMASALPIVATRVGGTPEILRDHETGVLVPPADAGAIARGLGEIAACSWWSLGMGLAARRQVCQRHTIDRMVQEYAAAYDAAGAA
jgi:glycosyltransferase involved in cell wall biosynthesis